MFRLLFLLFAVLAFAWAGWRILEDGGFYEPLPPPAGVEAAAPAPASPAPRTSLNGSDAIGDIFAQAVRQARPEVQRSFEDVPITYNRPEAMPLARATSVAVIVDATGQGDGARSLADYVGEIVTGRADLSASVSATLSGPGFEIEALSPLQQKLSTETENRWEWKVTPQSAGDKVLALEIFAHSEDGAEPVRAFRDNITITVSPVDQVVAFAQTAQPVVGLAAGGVSLLIALFGFLTGKRGGGRRRGGGYS